MSLVPTIENMVDDICFMIFILILKCKTLEKEFQIKPNDIKEKKIKDLYSDYVNEFERLIKDFIRKIEDIETKNKL